jgi:MFS family permease
MAEAHDPYGALRYRDYRLLLASGMLATIGVGMQATAVGWEVYKRTGSALALGLVGLAQFIPVLIWALPAGHAADRYSRRGMLQFAIGVTMTASLGLAALSYWEGPVELVFVCVTLIGTARAFYIPARMALLPQVIPTYLLSNAVTWNSTAWQIANVSGPALGGLTLVLAEGRADVVYVLAATCAFTCGVLVGFMRLQPMSGHKEPPSLASLLAGVRFVWQTKLLLAAVTLDLFAVLLGGATALLPIFAKDLGVNEFGFGCLRAAPSVGAMIMAVYLAHRPPLRRAGLALLLGVAGFGAATIGFGLSQNAVLSFILLALTGAMDNISVVVRHTLMQVLTPDAMRGRVAAVNFIFISSSNELGEFESGITAHWFGPVASVVGGGIGTIGVVVLAMLCWPELLRLGELHPPETAEPEKPSEAIQANLHAIKVGQPDERSVP